MVRTRWHTTRPIYTSVMVIGVAPFAVLELGATACGLGELPGCVAQSVWTTPVERAVVPGSFARAGDIVALFSRLVGPFPYDKLAHVASSTRYGGMENAGAIFYATELFKPGSPNESLIAHETAHQWFGDAVTEREWPHVWLSEGFATYFAALWSEHAHGDSAFRADLRKMRADVLRSAITTQKPVVDESLDDLRRVLNTNVYQKAGFVLHMLRREIGDTAFFGGIRAYYAAHRHGNAMTSDLQAEFEKASGRPLDWFFTQWLTRPGFMEMTPTTRWDAARRQLVLDVRQGTRFAPYRLSLSLDVTDASGVTTRVRVSVPAQVTSSQVVPVKLSAAPSAVVIDPDVSWLGQP
jgi:aminopeptidase N